MLPCLEKGHKPLRQHKAAHLEGAEAQICAVQAHSSTGKDGALHEYATIEGHAINICNAAVYHPEPDIQASPLNHPDLPFLLFLCLSAHTHATFAAIPSHTFLHIGWRLQTKEGK